MLRMFRVCSLIILALLAPCFSASAAKLDPNVAHGKKVLYVYNQTKLEQVRVANPPNPARLALIETQRTNDKKVIAFLESLGFVVTGANEASPVDAAKDKDLILISESVDALDVGAKYRDVPVPLITFENDLLPFLEMTGQKNDVDTGTKEKQRLMWLLNAPHPLAAGLAPGFQNVLDDENVRMNWGKPTPAAITIATVPGEIDKAAIFAYEKGATMNWEFLAPARRVSFFLYSDTFEHLRPEGIALFRAALLWAVSSPE